MKRKAVLAFVGIAVVVVLAAILLRHSAQAHWRETEAHLRAHQSALVAGAEALIARGLGPRDTVDVADVPAALRSPHLLFVQVFDNHVNLVIYTSPDVTSGFRVWTAPPSSDYADEPTGIPGVSRFSFNNDYPETPSNRL